jgi:hypothetical protein
MDGIAGSMCSPYCSATKTCPEDVPADTTARPDCVLESEAEESHCALVCGEGAVCPIGATCQVFGGMGICTF